MNFTNLLFKVVSLSDLNIFLHRLIDDGQYNSVFLYHNHALARDTNFRQEFSNYSSRYFTITTHCIGDEGCHDRFITNHIEGSLQIYIVYDANPNNIHRMDYYIKQRYATVGDTLYVIPMQNPRRKWKILNVDTGVNAQVVFYQTPETIENHISEKPIEVFLLNWALLSLRRYHILEVAIPSPSDRIHNFYSEVFQSEGQTVLMFMHRLDSWQRSEMVNNPERIMSYNKDVYMMNYICMNSRALVVQGMHKFNVDHFYALSDEKIYSELFISLRSTTKRQLRQMLKLDKPNSAVVSIEPVRSHSSRKFFPLYPHEVADFVFLIFQFGKANAVRMTSTAIPMLQWLAIIFFCSLVLHALRKFAAERNDYSSSFLDSVAIFLGNSINRMTNNRPERCFFVGFSLFGIVFKNILTGNLFVMYQQQNDQRISTINQLIQSNIRIMSDGHNFQLNNATDMCIGKPEKCFQSEHRKFTPHSLKFNESIAFYTSRRFAGIYLTDMKVLIKRNYLRDYDVYILEDVNDRLYMRYTLTSKPMEFDRLNNLIQRCVESGIYQFYSRWELYLRQLKLHRLNANNPQQNSDMITMVHIWIYVYAYFVAMGLCTVVFIGEHIHFHRARISKAMNRIAVTVWRKLKRIKSDVCLFANAAWIGLRKLLKRMRKRIFPYSLIPIPHRLMHVNRIAPIRRV